MTPFKVRPYAPEDRDGVRRVCCETGFMGEPVDRLFTDRQLFADFFTRYYTDYEPENCVVAEADGKVVGYLIGCCRYRLYPWVQARIVLDTVPKVIVRIAAGKYGLQNLRFLKWFTCKSWVETPKIPKHAAHFHVNILPDWRHGYVGRRLIFPFVRGLPERGVKRVYGQIQTYDDRRPIKVFERYGFKQFDRRKVTKFERFGKKGVYVSTVVREFD